MDGAAGPDGRHVGQGEEEEEEVDEDHGSFAENGCHWALAHEDDAKEGSDPVGTVPWRQVPSCPEDTGPFAVAAVRSELAFEDDLHP